MRLPPAKGFEGSAVWQLMQSPATANTLPRAMDSSDGSAAHALESANALHNIRLQRIARIFRRCPFSRGSSGRYSGNRATPSGRHAVSPGPPPTTQTATGLRHSGHDVAIFEGAAFRARFVMRPPEKAT